MIKKRMVCAAAAAVLLCGCSAVTVDENGTAAVSEAKVSIAFPEEWNIYTGSDIYERTYSRTDGNYSSADEMEKALSESGERYIVYAESADESALALFSAQSPGDPPVTAEELARSTHNSTVFDFRASEFYTESSLSEENLGGVSGWLSDIKVFAKQGEDILLEQKEFLFDGENNVYSLKIFTDPKNAEQSGKITISAK